ncbi:helix-turn-helix domain-containing protein [Micromonospora maris]|uniref:helix-turn-helix domain-containing protein n=1 Tax=Micromonospora maris TaxID=1003110 RepID=UPI001CB6DE2D
MSARAVTEDNPLTDREADVLQVTGEGYSLTDIAARLHLAPGTVRNYLSNAMRKTRPGPDTKRRATPANTTGCEHGDQGPRPPSWTFAPRLARKTTRSEDNRRNRDGRSDGRSRGQAVRGPA